MEKPRSACNPNIIRRGINRRIFLGAALAIGATTVLAACSDSKDDKIPTKGGSRTDNSCPEMCPICGQECWLQKDVQPHECPNGHYWKLRNGVWYVLDWTSGIYYDANGHHY